MSAAVREALADGRWHRVAVTAVRAEHNRADVGAVVMPLHVEVRGRMARRAPKAFCSLCAQLEARVARLEREVAKLRGGR